MKIRFGMRTLLIAITLMAMLLAYFGPGMVERYQIGNLRQQGAQVFTEPRNQYLFRQFAGDVLSERAVDVHLSGKQVDDASLEQLHNFPFIETISIRSDQVSDAGLAHLQGMPNLSRLYLVDTQATPAAIERLKATCPRLKHVDAGMANALQP